MLASSAGPAIDESWRLERKFDGLRCVVVREGSTVELWSRNHLSFNARFPQLIAALEKVPASSFVMDGEIVAFTASGATSFGALQQGNVEATVKFVAFDLLQLLGNDIRHLPLEDRTALLAKTLEPTEVLALSEPLIGSVDELLARACAAGWEGLVAKKKDSTYKGGRSPSWRKLKCTASQELVIGGWTEPNGARVGFGALLVGYYDGDDFRYAGKVGTGFSSKTLSELMRAMKLLSVDTNPFANGEGERNAHWLEPKLVANINFTEWTSDGRLRHPSFQGLRSDKDARQVVRES